MAETSIDMLCDDFEKITVNVFTDIFDYFFAGQPNTIINFHVTDHKYFLEGNTKFNSLYEHDFLRLIYAYNVDISNMYRIVYSKKSADVKSYYNCIYNLKLVLRE
jgi:hypothetical protein